MRESSFLEIIQEKTINAIEKVAHDLTQTVEGCYLPYIYFHDLWNLPVKPFHSAVNEFSKNIAFREKEDGEFELKMKIDEDGVGSPELRTTKAFLEKPFREGNPTLIFHHGAGQCGYRKKLSFTFCGGPELADCNLISVEAQAHDSRKSFQERAFDSLMHQQATFAGSVLMEEELVKWCKSHESPAVIVGSSMGGIVAAWHWLIFNTGDLYFPVAAYPNVTEIFLGPRYACAVDRIDERRKMPAYRQAFQAEPRALKDNIHKVFPILGEKDRIVDYNTARNWWNGFNILHFPYGHAVSWAKRKEIADYIAEKMRESGV